MSTAPAPSTSAHTRAGLASRQPVCLSRHTRFRPRPVCPQQVGYRTLPTVRPRSRTAPTRGLQNVALLHREGRRDRRVHRRGMREDPGGLILGSVLPGLDVAAVRAYCEQVVPPHALHEVRVETIVTRGAVTIVERRAPWRDGENPEWSTSEIARLRYIAARGEWTLCWRDRNAAGIAMTRSSLPLRSGPFSKRSTAIRPAFSGAEAADPVHPAVPWLRP
jgi:hypothetical protein